MIKKSFFSKDSTKLIWKWLSKSDRDLLYKAMKRSDISQEEFDLVEVRLVEPILKELVGNNYKINELTRKALCELSRGLSIVENTIVPIPIYNTFRRTFDSKASETWGQLRSKGEGERTNTDVRRANLANLTREKFIQNIGAIVIKFG